MGRVLRKGHFVYFKKSRGGVRCLELELDGLHRFSGTWLEGAFLRGALGLCSEDGMSTGDAGWFHDAIGANMVTSMQTAP